MQRMRMAWRSPAGWLLLIVLLLWSPTAPAGVIVLVHGYLGSGESFRTAGIVDALTDAGWQDGGDWQAGMNGQVLHPGTTTASEHTVYTVSLPAFAPLILQADWLSAMRLAIAKRHPGEAQTLVGHSAGGVIGRLSLVRSGAGSVDRLVTIASPHLGTARVWQALEATDNRGMFGPFRQLLTRQVIGGEHYDAIRHSRAVLLDLAPPAPGTLLAWLNQQEHPDIHYDAVVRNTDFRIGGDILVPAYSQDLNQVPALRGRASVFPSPLEHGLDVRDAEWLLQRLAVPMH